jgi:hypothetical protein
MPTRIAQAREDAGEIEASLADYCFSKQALLDRHLKAIFASWIAGAQIDEGLHTTEDRHHFATSLAALSHYHLGATCGLIQSDEPAFPLLTEQPH